MGFFTKVKNLIMTSTAAKIVTAAFAVVVLGGVGLVLANTVAKPENVLGAAIVKTFTGQTPAYEEVFGFTELSSAMEEKGSAVSFDVTIKDIPLEGLGFGSMSLPSAGILVEAKNNTAGAANGTITLNVADTPIASLNTYADGEKLQISIPDLFESVLSFPYGDENLKEKMRDSYVVELLGLSDETIDILADSISGRGEKDSAEEAEQRMTQIFLECYEAHLADAEVKKADKEEISVGEETFKCKVFEIRMDAQKVNDFTKDVSDRTVEYLKEIYAKQGMPENVTEVYFASLDEIVAEWKPAMQGEVVIKCYVADGRLLNTALTWQTEGNTESYCMEVQFSPEGYAFGNMKVSVQGPELSMFAIDIKTENTKEIYETEWKATADEEVLAFAFEYNKSKSDFRASVVIEEVSLGVSGCISELKKGSKLDVDFESFSCKIEDTEISQDLEASFCMEATEVEVIPLSGNQMDLLSMTAEDFETLSEESSTNITKKLFQLIGLVQ